MKKVLIGLLVVVMVLSLTSCSQELADLMGKMSNNVWGIEADTSAADEATANVDNAVEKDEDGNVTVSLSTAAAITTSISEIKDSPAKTEALKSQLSETVASTPEEGAAVKTAITTAITEAAASIETAAQSNTVVAELYTALTNVEASLSENPTKAELATVAILSEVASTVAEVATASEAPSEAQLNAYLEQGLAAYDTLVVVSEVANIDVIGDIDVASLLSGLSKDVSRAEDDGFDYSIFKGSMAKILNMVTTDKKFDTKKYNSFMLQATAIKKSMDLAVTKFVAENPDDILKKGIDIGFTIDDLGLYLVSSIFVEARTLGGAAWDTFAQAYVDANYDAIVSFGKDAEFKDVEGFVFLTAMATIDSKIDGSLSEASNPDRTKDSILAELGNDMKYALANQTKFQFTADVFNILRTAAVILVDAEYTGLLKMNGGDGTITGLLSLIK